MIPLDASSLLSPAAQVFCIRLTETLLHALWQGSAIGLLLVLASPGLRRLSPRLQYGPHVAALLLIAICALATFLSVGATARESRRGVIGGRGFRSRFEPCAVRFRSTICQAKKPVHEAPALIRVIPAAKGVLPVNGSRGVFPPSDAESFSPAADP